MRCISCSTVIFLECCSWRWPCNGCCRLRCLPVRVGSRGAVSSAAGCSRLGLWLLRLLWCCCCWTSCTGAFTTPVAPGALRCGGFIDPSQLAYQMSWIVAFRFSWLESVIYKSLCYLPLAVLGFSGRGDICDAVLGTLIGSPQPYNPQLGLRTAALASSIPAECTCIITIITRLHQGTWHHLQLLGLDLLVRKAAR